MFWSYRNRHERRVHELIHDIAGFSKHLQILWCQLDGLLPPVAEIRAGGETFTIPYFNVVAMEIKTIIRGGTAAQVDDYTDETTLSGNTFSKSKINSYTRGTLWNNLPANRWCWLSITEGELISCKNKVCLFQSNLTNERLQFSLVTFANRTLEYM